MLTPLANEAVGVGKNKPKASNADLLVAETMGDASVNPEVKKMTRGVVVEELGSKFTVEGRRYSARLAALAAAASTIDTVIDSDEGQEELNKLLQGLTLSGGSKKRQRGGEFWDIRTLYGFAELQSVQEKAAYMKAIAMMAIYNGSEMAKAGWTGTEAQRAASAAYFKENYAPLYGTGERLLQIIGGLADQLIVKAPVTTVMLTAAGVGYTVNFFRWVFKKYNEVGRATATDLMSDARAKSAAEAAVGGAKEALQTGVAVAFVANQLGVLPVSAVLAAILWQIQATLGTGGGRAYLVGGFYAWYKGQDINTKKALKAAAKKYAADAQQAAAQNAPAVKAAAREAAATLGGLLAKGTAATGSAFQAVAAAVTGAGGTVVAEQVAAATANGAAALQDGAPAAAIAAGQAGAAPAGALNAEASPFIPPGGVGGRRKTKKVKSKRHVTRRKKATKVLGAPVFIY
jgi:hypothetical protein